MDYSPIKYYFNRAMGRTGDLLKYAADSWTIGEACTREEPAAFFHPEELERIKAYQSDTTKEWEMKRIRGGKVSHDATIMYKFEDLIVRDGYAYCGGARMQMNASGAGPLIRRGNPKFIEKAMLVGFPMTAKYFGHWMTDQFPQELTAEEIGVTAIGVERDFPFSHEPGYRKVFKLNGVVSQWCHIKEAYYSVDYSQNAYKRERYEVMRKRLRASAKSPATNSGVMILRKQSGSARCLVNEMEVADYLRGVGFDVIDTQKSSVSEIINACVNTPLVISVEGSALSHALFSVPTSASVIAIEPPYRFNNVTKDYTDCLGMRYGFTVADPRDDGAFYLPIPRLEKAMGLVCNRVEHLGVL